MHFDGIWTNRKNRDQTLCRSSRHSCGTTNAQSAIFYVFHLGQVLTTLILLFVVLELSTQGSDRRHPVPSRISIVWLLR